MRLMLTGSLGSLHLATVEIHIVQSWIKFDNALENRDDMLPRFPILTAPFPGKELTTWSSELLPSFSFLYAPR
jgi:hypothetical protein